ncbi:MAG: hypothetical protein K2O70_11190, partial [Desulfovibrionaceae bacterium]|nr:hypothetical protein [Desulfovibrionaceae bacterium]
RGHHAPAEGFGGEQPPRAHFNLKMLCRLREQAAAAIDSAMYLRCYMPERACFQLYLCKKSASRGLTLSNRMFLS